jgi:hypothetical protein
VRRLSDHRQSKQRKQCMDDLDATRANHGRWLESAPARRIVAAGRGSMMT